MIATLEELRKMAGISGDASPKEPPSHDYLMELAGLNPYRAPRTVVGELSEEERQQIIGTVEPRGFVSQTIGNTTPGLIAESINRATMPEGVPYEPLPRQDFGRAGNIASQVGSLVLDPLTYGGGAAGGAVARRVLGEKLVGETLKRGIARGSIEGATMLGTLTAVHDPAHQYVETGEVDPLETAKETGKSVVLGAALGPAGKVPTRAGALAAEVGVFGAGAPALEGRLPTTDDFINAAGVILGIKGAAKVTQLAKALRERGPGDDPVAISEKVIGKEATQEVLNETINGPKKALLNDYRQRVEAGQKDPMPSADAFEAAGYGRPTRKERGPIITELLRNEAEIPPVPIIPEGDVPPEVHLHVLGEQNVHNDQSAEITQTKKGQNGPAQKSEVEQAKAGSPIEVLEEISGKPPSVPAGETSASDTPKDTTSLKNVATNAERAERGLPIIDPATLSDSVSDQQMVDVGTEALARDPQAGYRLVKSLKENPRSVNKAGEEGVLLVHRANLKRQYGERLRELVDAQERADSDKIAELTPIIRELEGQRADIEEVGTLSGRLTGQSLQGRKAWIDTGDYSLETMVMQDRADRGRASTPDEVATTKKLADAIAENARKQSEINALKAMKEAAKSVETAEKAVKRERSKRSAKAKEEFDAVWDELAPKFKGKLFSNPLDPELVVAGARLAKAYIKMKVAEFGDFFDEIKKRIGDAKAEAHRDIWEEAWRVAVSENKPQIGKRNLAKPAGLSRFAHELAKHFVETGVKDRDALIDAVHGELVRAVPGLTRRQAMDAISGYGQYKSLDKEQISAELRDLKGQMQQVGKLEDMAAGTAPRKTGVERRTPSDEERRLIQQVGEAKKKGGYKSRNPEQELKSALQARETYLKNRKADLEAQIAKGERFVKDKTPPPTNEKIEALRAEVDALSEQLDAITPKPELSDAQRLARYKEYLTRRDAELREQIASGKVEPKKRREYELDNEAENLRFEGERLIEQRKRMREKNQWDQKSPVEKAARIAGDVLFNATRTLQFGLDFGVAGVQGGFFAAGHPIKALRNFHEMLKALGDERAYSRIMHQVHERPNFKNGSHRRGRVAYSDPHGKLFKQEEAVRSSIIDRVPFLRAFPRATSAFLNLMRADYFDTMADGLAKDRRLSDVEAKAIGSAVNTATGRGDFGKFNSSIELLNHLFLAPRYVMSRFQTLMGTPLYRGTAGTRTVVAKEYARTLTGIAAIYGLSAFALSWFYGPPGKDKEWSIDFTDPRDSDFGKIRIGKRRINPLFGLQQIIVFGSRELGSVASKIMGYKTEKYGVKDPIWEFQRFLRTKAAPVPGTIYDWFKGKTLAKEKATPYVLMRNFVLPVNGKQIFDDMIENGVPEATAYGILNILGISVQNYEKKKDAA